MSDNQKRVINKKTRLTADIAMTVLLPMLMAYSLIGETFHEVIGTLMLILFIFHHVMNRKWHSTIFKGKYKVRRIVQTLMDLILLVVMLLQPVSGILMSKHLYTFIEVTGITAAVREIHLVIAYWGFVLMCVHVGMHLAPFIHKMGCRRLLRLQRVQKHQPEQSPLRLLIWPQDWFRLKSPWLRKQFRLNSLRVLNRSMSIHLTRTFI